MSRIVEKHGAHVVGDSVDTPLYDRNETARVNLLFYETVVARLLILAKTPLISLVRNAAGLGHAAPRSSKTAGDGADITRNCCVTLCAARLHQVTPGHCIVWR